MVESMYDSINSLIKDAIDERKGEKAETCKGLYWRGRVNCFMNGSSIETRKSLRLLKKMSCSGCDQCEWLWEYLNEVIGNEEEDSLSEIKDGLIYTFKVTTSHGYYDLYPEIDNVEFVEFKS
jgi:hypothetical protein